MSFYRNVPLAYCILVTLSSTHSHINNSVPPFVVSIQSQNHGIWRCSCWAPSVHIARAGFLRLSFLDNRTSVSIFCWWNLHLSRGKHNALLLYTTYPNFCWTKWLERLGQLQSDFCWLHTRLRCLVARSSMQSVCVWKWRHTIIAEATHGQMHNFWKKQLANRYSGHLIS